MGDTPKTTAAATRAHMRNAALRALDDPAALARAARIVRAALERQRLTLQDLTSDIADRSPDESGAV